MYSELTAMRTRTPFIDAFRKQQDQAKESASPAAAAVVVPEEKVEKVERDLSPKTMADSFHRVVSASGSQNELR